MNAVELDSISKRFGEKVAVNSLTTAIPEGTICGIIGPNGSGKTTTLRMILDIIQPDEGVVRVFGKEGSRLANDQVSYLPEERGLYKKMKVAHQLAYFARLKNVSERNIQARSKTWLERMGLEDVYAKKVETLSKGMAQKIQFIGSVLNEPKFLILDEPFSGLDPVNMEIIRESILEMRNQGTTILFSTHDMGMAEKMCDTILMIYEGNKVLDGTMAQIQSDYGDDTVRVRLGGLSGFEAAQRISSVIGEATMRDFGRYQELKGIEEPQGLLNRLAGECQIEYFEITPPNLHDIFVRIARPSPEEAKETQGEDAR